MSLQFVTYAQFMRVVSAILKSLTVILSIIATNIAFPSQREAVPTLLLVLLPLVTLAQLCGFWCTSDEQRGYLFSSQGSSWWWIPPWQTCPAASICHHRDCSHIRLLCFDAFSIAGLCHELYILIWGSRLWWSDLSFSDCIDCINLSSWTFALC